MFKKLLLGLIIAVPVIAQADWMEWSKYDEFVTYIDPDRTVKTYETLNRTGFVGDFLFKLGHLT